MNVIPTSRFRFSLKKLPIALVEKVVERTLLFKKNPFDPLLQTHKLHGKLKNKWSFSVDNRFRVVFEFNKLNRSEVIFLDIGDHDLYR
ncbi:MAG: type II toxin-antitoxin system mRNA interferase toxin, RelE/StbE family [Patescibacteria group bacterium]|jgi:mRNA-degrading endonuclease YafQ of YafQ-DinJ toxin-antitoxin module